MVLLTTVQCQSSRVQPFRGGVSVNLPPRARRMKLFAKGRQNDAYLHWRGDKRVFDLNTSNFH